ncbi:TOBE domain-containing protein [Robertkochia aurantiaca]|uniref:TOBE domain-containing protein n=1 Tax=Robertkochia aurantiaca TaxID=2873700 RepID=UPI001CCE8FA8|nr:TOBE domain-containing protein [Robertkochia sp. 3YJGBD-33]
MNNLRATIIQVETHDKLSLVTARTEKGIQLQVMVIDTPQSQPYLHEGKPVNLLFKETDVIISGHDESSLGILNRISGRINRLKRGIFLSKLVVDTEAGRIHVIFHTAIIESLKLEEEKKIWLYVKFNDIMIQQS